MEATDQAVYPQTTTVEIPLEEVAKNSGIPAPSNLPAPEPVTNLSAPEPFTNLPAPESVTNLPAPESVTNLPAPESVTNLPVPEPVTNLPAPEPVTNLHAPEPVTNLPVPGPDPNLPPAYDAVTISTDPKEVRNIPVVPVVIQEPTRAMSSMPSAPEEPRTLPKLPNERDTLPSPPPDPNQIKLPLPPPDPNQVKLPLPPEDIVKESHVNNIPNGIPTFSNGHSGLEIDEKSPFLEQEVEFLVMNNHKEEIIEDVEANEPPPSEDENEFWTDEEDEGQAYIAKKTNPVARLIIFLQSYVKTTYRKIKEITRGNLIKVTAFLCYMVYFGYAMSYEFGSESSYRLLAFTVVGLLAMFWDYISSGVNFIAKRLYGAETLSAAHAHILRKVRTAIRWFFYLLLAAVMVYVLVEEGRNKPENLKSVPGLFIFILILVLLCPCPHMINWYTIYWAIGLQFLFALAVLRSKVGRGCILWVQSRLDEFFASTIAGSKLLFGDGYKEHYMIFGALPIMFFANAMLSILYYLGVIQCVVKVIGGFLNFVLDTSPAESTSVATGIFLEGVTSVLVLRPYLRFLSKSQLFLVVTSVFASLGGAYLAILSGMGVSLEYLISAMVISAPATFAVCKLMVPETKWTKKKDRGRQAKYANAEHKKSQYNHVLDAGQAGAMSMMSVFAMMAITIFTFFSFIDWINNSLTWFGDRVGIEKLTMEMILSYLLYPVALIMGIEPADCNSVAMLLGYRLSMTNMVGFFKLRMLQVNKMIYNKYMMKTNFSGPVTYDNGDIHLVLMNKTLVGGFISDRSEAVVTYSLCGFSSMLAVVVIMGILCTLVPTRKAWITSMVLPALIAGNVANCMTGCFASIFYEG